MEAITREEKIMSGESLKPITRKELFLAKAAGQSVAVPEPKTREEIFLSRISGEWGVGGSAPVVRSLSVTENGTYSAPYGVDGYNPVQVNVQSKVEPITITENGTYNPPSGVDGYAPIVVNVESAGGVEDSAEKYFEAQYAEVSLPNAISIKPYAFYLDGVLTDISMPNVTSIGSSAFQNCSSLAITSLPNGLTSIGDTVFQSCSRLAISSLPDGLTMLGARVFNYCPKITVDSLPIGIMDVGSYTFYACTSITSFTFKGRPNSIASNAFGNNPQLTTINVPWAEGEVSGAPWGATNATINYNYAGV